MDFVRCTIGDIAKVSAGGDKPQLISAHKTKELTIPVYSNGLENDGLFGFTNQSKIEGDTVTVSARGVNIGTVCFREEPYTPIVRLLSLIPDRNRVEGRYLFYALKNTHFAGTGSAQPQITVPMISSQEIIIHKDLTIQNRISRFLTVLDHKIRNNDAINKNLAEQIQAIYCNYFDPSTHTPSGNLSDICKYSSDKIAVSDLSVSTYFSTENMQSNKAGAVDATSLPAMVQTTRCHKGDVLISNIRPYFKKIVYVTDDWCGCSTDVLCFVPKENLYSAYLFGTLYLDRFFDYMVAGSKGTKMPRGDKQQIMNYPVVIPAQESLNVYNETIVPMLDQISTNRVENIKLAALRDTLLPKLMSGELDVSDIDI